MTLPSKKSFLEQFAVASAHKKQHQQHALEKIDQQLSDFASHLIDDMKLVLRAKTDAPESREEARQLKKALTYIGADNTNGFKIDIPASITPKQIEALEGFKKIHTICADPDVNIHVDMQIDTKTKLIDGLARFCPPLAKSTTNAVNIHINTEQPYSSKSGVRYNSSRTTKSENDFLERALFDMM